MILLMSTGVLQRIMSTKQVKLYLTPELHKALGHSSVEREETMSAIAERALRQHFGLPPLQMQQTKAEAAIAS